jgi:uncharacterized protein YjbI with pentapeptide repeats
MDFSIIDKKVMENNEFEIKNELINDELLLQINDRYSENVKKFFNNCIIEVDFSKIRLQYFNFIECRIKANFINCFFDYCSSYKSKWDTTTLNMATWSHCELSSDDFDNCDLSKSTIEKSDFSSCTLKKCNLKNCNTNLSKIHSCKFLFSDLSYSVHHITDCTCSVFQNCSLINARFAECDLRGVEWEIEEDKKEGLVIH